MHNARSIFLLLCVCGMAGSWSPYRLHGQSYPSLPSNRGGWYDASDRSRSGTNSHGEMVGSRVVQAGLEELVPFPGGSGDVAHEWREYDLRPFTDRLRNDPQPQQTIVDWILRETGTDAWFGSAPAVLSANREQLRVYHRPEVQQAIEDIVERFVHPYGGGQFYSVRLVTVVNPNWRAKAMPRLRPVTVQTDGVEAWLLSREDAAIVYNELKKRNDFREHNSPNLLISNGQSYDIQHRRPLAYVKSATGPAGSTAAAGLGLEMGKVEEGFSLSLSPLLSRDGMTVDAVIRLEASQVEKLTNVSIPTLANPRQTTQVQVPQTSRWRMHERFRWPVHEVLMISCGVVAIPDGESANPLSLPMLPTRPPRADAMVLIEARGPATDLSQGVSEARRSEGINFRGRY